MADPVTCPHCREHLDIPAEYRGRPVRCASCQNVFTVPSPSPVGDAPQPDARRSADGADDRPRGQRPPRSNAGVWVLLLVTLVVVGGCVGLCGGGVWFNLNPKMHAYTSAEGKFRVEFPGDPAPDVTPGEKGPGSVSAVGYRGEQQAREQYRVKCYNRPLLLRFIPDADALDELAKTELADLGLGTEMQRETTTHDGHPALDLMAESGKGLLSRRVSIVRLVVSGNKVYVVMAQGLNMDPKAWWVRRFFTSFELTDQPAKPAAKKGEDKDGAANPFNPGAAKPDDDEK